MEHSVFGSFDEYGVFRGQLRVFGKDRGEIVHTPKRPPPFLGKDRLGAFDFCIGTFEVVPDSSTHDAAVHSSLLIKVENYSGLYLYRNQLRVMPYGSPKADLFSLEENRSKHAGRYFWSHRRSFGRAAFTRQNNPNLRDKAGREGLVDNRAFRELRLLVEDLLQSVALRYFGTQSDIRLAELETIQTANKKNKEAAEKARKGRTKNFRKFPL